MANNEKIYLLILDGFGEGKDYEGNAIIKAHMKNLEALKQEYPWTLLKSDGEAVGLPEGTMGGSEVGHFTMGAGRVIFQKLEEINRAIKSSDFLQRPAFLEACKKVNETPKAALHLLGMISDAGIHSHTNHLFALLELAKQQGVTKTFIHAITDGRDVPEKSAEKYIEMINQKILTLGMGAGSSTEASIATIIGRFFSMDRDTNWNRTEKAYNLYVNGEGKEETDPIQAIHNAYTSGVATDYYIEPIILNKNGVIKSNDSVIFWNYRTDRTRQLTYAFTGEEKIGFETKNKVEPFFVCFGDYSKKAPVVFPTPVIKNNLGSILEENKIEQLRIAETEKYAHVTYFFNSQVETPFKQETRILIDSPKTPSYADKPEMSAAEVTNRVLREMEGNKYQVIIQNFANPDMVGHSGNMEATVKACQVIDECIGKIAEKAKQEGYQLMITADHGNAEYMIYEKNHEQCPSHTNNPVIFLLVSEKYKKTKLKNDHSLQDIAPTILEMMEIQKPSEMTGESLLS